MADHYQQSSFCIDLKTCAETDWWKKEKARTEKLIEAEVDNYENTFDPEDAPEGITPQEYHPFSKEWSLEQNDDGHYVWFHSDNIDIESVEEVIQRFLQECRPNWKIGFSWSNTCSKMRPDQFGGGAMVISATDSEYITTEEWLSQNGAI